MNAYDYQKELDILFTQTEKLWFEVENYAELDDHPDLGDARDQLKWVLAAMSESARLNLKYRSTLEPEQAFWRAWATNQQRDIADRMEEWEIRNMYPSFNPNKPNNVEVSPILAMYLTDEILDTISKDRDEQVLTELIGKMELSDGRAVWYGIPGSPRMGFMTDSEMEVCIGGLCWKNGIEKTDITDASLPHGRLCLMNYMVFSRRSTGRPWQQSVMRLERLFGQVFYDPHLSLWKL